MMAKNDGGPAFPAYEHWNEWSESKAEYMTKSGPRNGMSLRDYFAGQALTGAFVNGDTDIEDDIMARRCYEIADAMLAERAKE